MSERFAGRGTVYFVGAGPGDPGLLTLRGAQCLGRADLVLFDYLANPAVLRHCRPDAELICLGRHGRDELWSQEQIQAALVEHARHGRCVVRLKGGDPAVFGRLAEECAALAAANVPWEIVPGVTAALAAGSYAGVALTHRDSASAVALVTAHESPDKTTADLDYPALAQFPGTLVFYMGVTTVEQWTKALIDAGKPADTPVAVVRRCSWPDQRVIYGDLGGIAAQVQSPKLRPPALFVVGPAVGRSGGPNWFTSRPLFGQRVLVARPLQQALEILEPLRELGADVLVQPAIEIGPPADWAPVDRALARLGEFDWLVFSSVNGVRHLLDRLWQLGQDLRALGGLRLAAIGPGTAAELQRRGLRTDLLPDEYRAEALAEALARGAAGKRFLLARASRGREVLAEQLLAAGGEVEQVVVYESRDVAGPHPEVAAALAAGQIDWTLVTSSSIARSLARMFGDELSHTKLASISPVTSQTLRELGRPPEAEACVYTLEGLIDAIR